MKTTLNQKAKPGMKFLFSQMGHKVSSAREESMSNMAFALGLLAVIVLSLIASGANAQVSKELSNLGSNSDVKRRASALESRSRVAIVQGRTVKRDWRFELGGSYGPVAVGDSYLITQNLGGQIDLHINPKFSLGVRYAKAFNDLTAEGKQRFDAARAAKLRGQADWTIPDIDYPEESLMGVVNWYMFYGKMNFFDLSVVQFDIYSLAGYGNQKLASGNTPTWTAGGGIGFWITNHITSRVELRYQSYQDQVYTGARDLNLVVANFGLGVLL
jgi:outer membrane beta-barrel protein